MSTAATLHIPAAEAPSARAGRCISHGGVKCWRAVSRRGARYGVKCPEKLRHFCAPRRTKVAAAVASVEADWATDKPLADLVARSGVTAKTLYKHLGPRADARRARERKEKISDKR